MCCPSTLPVDQRLLRSTSRVCAALAVVLAAGAATACRNAQPVLTQLLEARRLASELHVEFTKASEAANRAVMAETDEASTGAASEARRAREVVERDVEALQPLLQSLGYRDDVRYLERVQGAIRRVPTAR